MADWHSSLSRPCHYVAVDRANQAIILSIRCAAMPVSCRLCMDFSSCADLLRSCCLPRAEDKLQCTPCSGQFMMQKRLVQCVMRTVSGASSLLPSGHLPATRKLCRGSLEAADVFSDISASPLEMRFLGADGHVHEVIFGLYSSECFPDTDQWRSSKCAFRTAMGHHCYVFEVLSDESA